MSFIYPNNRKRVDRLNQLAGDIANKRNEFENSCRNLSRAEDRLKNSIHQLITAYGQPALAEMMQQVRTDEESATCKQLAEWIEKKEMIVDDVVYRSGMLMGASLTGQLGVELLRDYKLGIQHLPVITGYMQCIKIASTDGISAGMQALTAFNERTRAIKNFNASSMSQRLDFAAQAMKWVGILSMVVSIGGMAFKFYDGSQNKEKLISAIHEAQSRRLLTAYACQIATTLAVQANGIDDWCDMMLSEDPVEKAGAPRTGKKVINKFLEDLKDTSFETIETQLAEMDRNRLFVESYFEDDLSDESVVRKAKEAGPVGLR